MRAGWAWSRAPGEAIGFERGEAGFSASLSQVRTPWQSLRVWRTDVMSLVMAVPGALVAAGVAIVGLVLSGHPAVMWSAGLLMAVGGMWGGRS